jgi:NAD(P)H-hydrate epimerase
VLTGVGNNGGDGFVAARHLKDRGVDVVVQCLAFPKGEPLVHRSMGIRAARAGVPIAPLREPVPADLIIDALFAVGFHGTLPEVVVPWLEHPAPVLAVDVPSGLDATTGEVASAAFRATNTVTFHALKTGMLVGAGPDHCGVVSVADIGLTGERADWLVCEDDDAAVPARPRGAHKWSAGSVAVAGGSPGIVGAAVLTGSAALSFGAGAVRVLVPGALRPEAASMTPSLMTDGVGTAAVHDDAGALLAAADRFDVLVVGPGMGASEVVEGIVTAWDRALVIDADALRALTPDLLRERSGPTVITPHAGEFEALAGEPASPPAAARLAEATGAVVLLKGSPTFVMGEQAWVVTSGGPELATIGTGDVLAGMVAALIARGSDPEAAARSAAHRHGRAAAALAATGTVTAGQLTDEIRRFAW